MTDTTLTGLSIWDGRERVDADAIRISDEATGGRIQAIGSTAELAPGSSTIDCGGLTALPGLIDAHVHMELDPENPTPPTRTTEEVVPHMGVRAEAMVRAGITTARDLGGGAWFELGLRDRIARGEQLGPRLVCAGQPVTSMKGHCHFWGGEAAGFEEAKEVMRRQLEKGVDLIKVMATGGRMTKGTQPIRAQFDLETLTRIVAFAGEHGKAVAAHCHGTEGIDFAARAGVSTIEHCSWVGEEGWASDYQEEVAERIVAQGTVVSPTINKGWRRMLHPKAEKVLGRLRTAYRSMRALDVPFVTSTDAGIPGVFHHDLPHALDVFAQIAELTPEQTLRMATSEAARAIGLEAETGRIAPGLSADLLLVHGDPLADLGRVTEAAAVFARGAAVIAPS